MSVGLLAHLAGRQPYRQLAASAAELGFDYVQLALSKAVSDVDFSLGKMSPGLANEVGGAFADQRVGIAVLGCYASLIELDDERYRHNVDRFKEHLRHARHFGCSIVATEVGVPPSQDPDLLKRHDARLDRALEELVEEAERWGVTIGLEAAQRHLIDSAETMASAIERFPSSCVGVVIDPCNLLNETILDRQDDVIEEAIRLLGPRIVSTHAKDLKRGPDGSLTGTAAGLGDLNYPLFWELLVRQKPFGFVSLECVAADQMPESARFVRESRAAARR